MLAKLAMIDGNCVDSTGYAWLGAGWRAKVPPLLRAATLVGTVAYKQTSGASSTAQHASGQRDGIRPNPTLLQGMLGQYIKHIQLTECSGNTSKG